MTLYTNLTRYIFLTLYTLLIVCMGFATVIGRFQGDDYAHTSVYGSWWFICLWAFLAAVSLFFLIRKNVHRRMGLMLLHLSFAIILIGALITHLTSESGTVHLRKGEEVASFVSDDGLVRSLPFTMTMTDFEVISYPGSDAVMDYCCRMEVKTADAAEVMTVSMNNIGKACGYRFYQSAYDSDCEGSQLLVSWDPYGIAVSYVGYVCLLAGLLWVMCSRHTRIRQLYRMATRPLALVLLLVVPTSMNAQQLTPVSREIADGMGQVAVLYNGRICPLNTAATEFVTKLCGKSEWKGYSANEIFLSWMIYYTEWEEQPVIRVKDKSVQQLLGIDGGWASVKDFYTYDHKYKLSAMANDSSLPASVRKAIRETDEKLQVVSMFYNSEMLHIFPLTVEGRTGWYTPGSTELPIGTPEAEFQFINHIMDQLTQCVLVNDVANARMLIAKIRLYQKEKAADFMPSSATLRMEVLYNKVLNARWMCYLYLTLAIIFCMISLMSRKVRGVRLVHGLFILSALIWITALLVMRWWISGHVPMSNGFETMLFMAWVTLVVSVSAMKVLPILKAFGPVVSSFCMLVATIATGSPQITNLMPVLQSPLLSVHVALVMVSYALFAIITMIAVYSLFLSGKNRHEEVESMTALSALLLYPAVALLAMGIFIGAVWANISWGTYWSWDPKETWALITLMVYAIPLHRSFVAFPPHRFNLYILVSFLAVLMTYFGVNYFLPGMHSYYG